MFSISLSEVTSYLNCDDRFNNILESSWYLKFRHELYEFSFTTASFSHYNNWYSHSAMKWLSLCILLLLVLLFELWQTYSFQPKKSEVSLELKAGTNLSSD